MERPFVVFVSGLPGSGKSYFASRLAEKLDADYLSSDRIRKYLFEKPSYLPTEKEQVYDEMAARMEAALKKDCTVVLDSTFYRLEIRKKIREKISLLGLEWKTIYIYASADTVRMRTQKKRPDSDADYGVHLMLKSHFAPFDEDHLRLLSTNENIDEMLDKALKYLDIA